MSTSINACLAELKTLLEAALVPAEAGKVYGFRVLPNLLDKAVSVTFMGGTPGGKKTGGTGRHLDFAAVIVAQHDGSEAGLEAAEQALNAMENIIVDTLEPSRNTLWSACDFHRPSTRPPTPEELRGSRYGEIYFRLDVR